MKKIAIQGHPTQYKDVIKALELLGGTNDRGYVGYESDFYYYINNRNFIGCDLKKHLPQGYKKYTLKEYKQQLLNTMETKRNIQIDLTTAQEWYRQGGDLRKVALQAFTENELQLLPKSWKEYCEINPYLTMDKEFFLALDGTVTNVTQKYYRRADFILSMSSKKKAEQFIVLNKLLQIKDYYNQGWEPDWSDVKQEKFIIGVKYNKLFTEVFNNLTFMFAFKTPELRDEFIKNFKPELEFIKEFL